MPRARRGWEQGACYHITHRCRDKEYLFRYAKYRNFYVRTLFKAVQRYHIDVLNYIVTGNHVHLLVAAKDGIEISNGLRYLHGRIGQWYNNEKGHSGSFWGDRFHSTRIQTGTHLANCLLYIDLNMVRAGVVEHPVQWSHSAYMELAGKRQRCHIVNMKRLLKCLGMRDEEMFRLWHEQLLLDKLSEKQLQREEYWSNSVAVGERDWLEQLIKGQKLKRQKVVEAKSACFLRGSRGKFSK
jgi:putative transposase